MYPLVGEPIKCEYCNKRVHATEGMEPWISVSEVKAGQESHVGYFCSYYCLHSWGDKSEAAYLARAYERVKDEERKREEKEMKGTQ